MLSLNGYNRGKQKMKKKENREKFINYVEIGGNLQYA